MNRRQGFWSPYVTLHGVLNESYPPPARFFLVFLAAVSVVMLSGCATKSLDEAIKGNDVATVRSYISSGKNLNQDYSANRGGLQTPVGMAALFAGDEISKLLIENGANINVPSFTSQRPICTFIHKGKEEMVSLLIKKGVDINEECELGLTPLQKAAYGGQIEIVKLLIANGAKINYANKYGITAVTWAKKGGQQDVANYLVSKGGKQLSTNIDAAISAGGEDIHAYALNRVNAEREQREEEEREQKRREKAESRAFWKGAATVGVGIAVGNATRNLAPDQQERMMRSSMNSVQSGDASEIIATTQQVKAERTQEHNAKMQAVEAQKEREGYDAKEAEAANNRRMMDASIRSHQPSVQNTTNRQQPPAQSWNNQANRSANSNANSSKNAGNTQIASNQNGVGADSSSDNENWKSAFTPKLSWPDCEKKAKELHGRCDRAEVFKPVFTAADRSAAEQSKLCSETKNRALNSNSYAIVEDLGCGCYLNGGNLYCTYFTIGKSRHKSVGGGKSK